MRRRFFVVAVAALVAGCAGSAATLAPGVPTSDAVASGPGTAVSAPPFPTSPSSSFAGGSPVPGGSNALAAVTKTMDDLKATALEAEIHVGGRPDWQTSLNGSLWVSTGDSFVARIDEKKNAVVAKVNAARPCFGLAAGFNAIWAPSCGADELDRIDPSTNAVVARIPLDGIPGDGEGQLVAAAGSVWMFTDDHGTLARIDPKQNKVIDHFATGVNGIALAATPGALWASVPDANAVAEIGLDGKLIQSIPVGKSPRFIAADETGVWVLGQGEGDVTRIDPRTAAVLETIPLDVPGEGGCIATGGGGVWVTMPGIPVSRIDAATNSVTDRFTGAGGDCISYAAGSVWLSNNDAGTVWRLKG